MNKDYQKFFELREKFPNKKELISKLMSIYFQSNDSFPEKFYIPGYNSGEDLKPFLAEFGISAFSVNNSTLRNQKITFIVTSNN